MIRDYIKIGLSVIFFIGGILIIANLVNGYGERKWKGWGRFTVIKIGEKVVVESIDPKSNIGTRLFIPEGVEINTLQQRGQWKPKSLSRLGGKYGWKWVGDSIADYLGISYTTITQEMVLWDKLEWWRLSLRTKWKEIDLGDTNLLTSRTSWDNEKVLGVSDKWVEKSRELFYAVDLGNSGLEVRVWNSTTKAGVAGRAAAVLESSGLPVIQVGERESNTSYCRVVSDKSREKSPTVKWIMGILGCEWRGEDLLGNMVEVYLGQGYAERY